MASDQAGEHSTWIVDSGASHNIISNLQNLSLHFEYGGKENIMIDNGNDIPITHIEDYLYGRKLHLPLLGTKPESMKVEEWAFLDKQVLEVIRLTLSRSVAHNVVKEKTTADLMKALSGMYEKLSANNKVHLMKKLLNLKMVENASIAQHLNEFNTITNQLSSIEIDFDDEIRALIVLASLPNSWEAMMMVVSNSTGKEKLKYNDIRDLILAEEIRRRYAGETSGSSFALNLETRGRGNDRNSNQGRSKSRNSNRNISKSRSSQQVQCWNCGKTGHFKRQCKNPKKKNEDDSANIVTEEVYLVDGSALDVVGLGDVQISLPNEFVWLLEKVTKRARALAHEKKTGTLTLKTEKLELVHTDLWGPSSVASLGGSRSRRPWLRQKQDGEDYSWTPQQNGVAERMNRTLNERARSMRLHVGLPKTFWADAVSTTAYLINRGPSVPMEFRLPEEVDLSTPVAEVRRSSRNIRPPQRYSPVLNYLLLTDGGEPECYDEALQDENSSKKEGFAQQKEGIDYTKIFSPVVKMSTIRLVLGMVVAENLHLEQLDVKTTFLYGDLEEDLYMIQPEGFIVQRQENLVCKLRKRLYDLKQAPR
ncbi:Retrovirus-related Pol polyprotein from transposon TNT 1-94 [Vitis vinifera]|uniref:Retrovirus-related Pol polyprotein from transposon TNT 1-94 n=1 Tax=Vitis vinifera TaxID=29760 RepID=A0A438JP09_VITVI|nr:Retrovirus-related Pol polyprotein from transposon TNT 1-94 [Vitis vinifera]